MDGLKRIAGWIGILIACGLLILSGTRETQHIASAHPGLIVGPLLSTLVLIPTGLVTLAAGFCIEAVLVGWSRSSLKALAHASPSVRLDLLSMIMTLLPHRYLGYGLTFGLFWLVDSQLLQPAHLSLTHLIPGWGLQVLCVVLFSSFISYWVHRLEHAIPALWALHQFHHSADTMSVLTAVRQTELARAVERVLPLVFLALLAEPTDAKPSPGSPFFLVVMVYFLYRTFQRVNQYLVHSNLTTDYGWVGRWLLVSPRMHRLHHATSGSYFNKNFTFDLVIWDRLFGTYAACEEQALPALSLGVSDSPFNSGRSIKSVLRDYFVTSYVVFWRALRQGGRVWVPERLQPSTYNASR